ncbi:MAG: hypothetical protein AAGD11_12100 [Planctomycetota bacterium]
MPSEIAHLYENEADRSVSDEFDAQQLDTGKWDYRTAPTSANWLQSNTSLENQGEDRYLELRGEWKRTAGADGFVTGTGSSSGIYSKKTMGHGFYTARWRVEGISPNHKSSWHPAIWCHRSIPTTTNPSRLPQDHIELDFVEFSQSRTQNIQWHCQAVEWVRNREESRMTPIESSSWSSDFQEGVWSTHGLEYHPDYVQLWEFDEISRQWSQRGEKISITTAATDKKALNINKSSAHEQAYWILSNYDFFERVNKMWEPYHGRKVKSTDNFLMSESSLQIDYFRFRPLKTGNADDQ